MFKKCVQKMFNKLIMWEEQLVDPLIYYKASVIAPWSSVLNKPVNPEPCYYSITQLSIINLQVDKKNC